MSQWLGYGPSDLLLFSPTTYLRLFELYNTALWPPQWVTLALGVLVIVSLYTKTTYRQYIIAGILTAMWLWVGWAFHLQRYANINWAAPAFAVLFFMEGALIGWYGLILRRVVFQAPATMTHWLGLGLVLYAVALHPLLSVLVRGQWDRAEVIGMAPDPSALATLGVLLLGRAPLRGILFLIPLLWCVISALTLYAMATAQVWIPALGVLLVVVAISLQALGKPRPNVD